MDNGLISFIILLYRNYKGIYYTLQSIFDQDYPYIEIIISDDHSPNFEEEIINVKQYIQKNKPNNIIRVIYNHLDHNEGTVKNANKAIRLARGKYIKALGADDTLSSPGALSRYVECLESSGCLICFSKLQGIDDQGNVVKFLSSCANDYSPYRHMTPLQIRDKLFARNFLPAPAWLAKKELFDRYGYFLETTRLIEDYPYWIYLCTKGVRFAFIDDVLVNYRLSGVSSTGSYGSQFMQDMYSIYDKWIFPYDKRYGIFQNIYNAIKKAGLNAYTDRARWQEYTVTQKMKAWIKHGIFYAYIDLKKYSVKKKNEGSDGSKQKY